MKRALILGVPIEDAVDADAALALVLGRYDLSECAVINLGMEHRQLCYLILLLDLVGNVEWLPEVGRACEPFAYIYDTLCDASGAWRVKVPTREAPRV